MDTGCFPGAKSGLGVTLTPQSLLLPWSWKSRAIPLLPYGPYALYRTSVPVQEWPLPLGLLVSFEMSETDFLNTWCFKLQEINWDKLISCKQSLFVLSDTGNASFWSNVTHPKKHDTWRHKSNVTLCFVWLHCRYWLSVIVSVFKCTFKMQNHSWPNFSYKPNVALFPICTEATSLIQAFQLNITRLKDAVIV
jgi:hypothetical protein